MDQIYHMREFGYSAEHSPLMKEAAEAFQTYLKQVGFRKPKYPLLSSVTGEKHTEVDEIVHWMGRQMVSPVRWVDCLNNMIRLGANQVIEVGSNTILRNMISKSYPGLFAISFEEELEKPTGIWISHERAALQFACKSLVMAVSARNGNEDIQEKEYNEGVIKPYAKLTAMVQEAEAGARTLELRDVFHMLDCLKTIFTTKCMPIHE